MADATVTYPAPSWRADLRAGYLAMLPLWLGAAPFGVIYAVSALAAGLTPAQTLAMSLLVFAGAAQFTAVGMVAAGAGPLAITLTTLIINARHLLMAASLAPHLRGVGPWRRLLLAAGLTDESYAVGVGRYLEGRGSAAFQIGCNLSLYTCWPLSTVAGIALGQAIPDPAAYGLDLVFPLTFIGLLVPLLRQPANRPAAAIAAALTVLGALLLPGSWYVLLAGAGASALAALALPRRAAGEDDPTPGGAP
ncbi:MAG TPA: AzlC family ABC transporter permease [Chloroflexaceae bacterium]|nr:AzlC family ABC transporter permease [Chloroflexaceae bacterium]